MNKGIVPLAISCLLLFLTACASNKSTYTYTPAEINSIKAKNWLAMNLKREGVQQLESGLQYKILQASAGCQPDPDYKVTVHYNMISLASKKVIDSSYSRGNPDKFKLAKMIKGWREGVPMMKIGETWEFYIPAELAYGKKGLRGSVAPNSLLVSKVNLIAARCQK